MAKITSDEMDHLSQLSRIKLEETKVQKYSQEIEAILDYVAECEDAPVEEISGYQIRELENIVREDETQKSLPVEKVLENAPEKQDSFIKVKKVF